MLIKSGTREFLREKNLMLQDVTYKGVVDVWKCDQMRKSDMIRERKARRCEHDGMRLWQNLWFKIFADLILSTNFLSIVSIFLFVVTSFWFKLSSSVLVESFSSMNI